MGNRKIPVEPAFLLLPMGSFLNLAGVCHTHDSAAGLLYEYQPSRRAEHAAKILEGFPGYLHADGYQGYIR